MALRMVISSLKPKPSRCFTISRRVRGRSSSASGHVLFKPWRLETILALESWNMLKCSSFQWWFDNFIGSIWRFWRHNKFPWNAPFPPNPLEFGSIGSAKKVLILRWVTRAITCPKVAAAQHPLLMGSNKKIQKGEILEIDPISGWTWQWNHIKSL